jgi:hypothetical protein
MQSMLLVSAIAKILRCLPRSQLSTPIFLASTVAGDADMHEEAEYAFPERPYFIVVGAKKLSLSVNIHRKLNFWPIY